MRSHSLTILLPLITGLLLLATAVCQPTVSYEYAVPKESGDFGSSSPMKLPLDVPHKQECDCGYVLVEKLVHVCRPEKSYVKVLRREGNCLVHEKPLVLDPKYVDFRLKPDLPQPTSACDDTSSQEDFE